jgi:hypothetical protein
MLTDSTCHVDTDDQVMQLFGSEGDRIRRLDVRITEAQPGSQLQLNLFDADRNKLLHREVTVSDEDIEKGWVSFKLGYDLEKGGSYFLELRVPEVTGWMPDEDLQRLNSSLIILGLEDHGTTTATANSYVTTVQEELQDYNLILRYHYLIDFNVIMTVVSYLLLALVAFLLIRFVIPRLVSADSEVGLGKVFATVLDPSIIVSALILLIQIFPICTFGRKWYDIVFNYIGVCMLAGLLLYLIHRKDAFKA